MIPLTVNTRSTMMEHDLDLRGLKCPMPVLRTRKALAGLAAGTTLTVRCTDPLAAIDIPHLVAELGHDLLGQERRGHEQLFTIRKRTA